MKNNQVMRPNVSELLEKINRIAQKPEFPAISKIEKDILKHYLRELYELADGDVPVSNTLKSEIDVSHKPPIPKFIADEGVREIVEEQPVKKVAPEPAKEIVKEIVQEPEVEPVKQVAKETLQPEQLIVSKPVEEQAPVSRPKFITREDLLNKAVEPDTASVKASVNDLVKPYQTLNERIKGSGREIHKVLSSKPLKDMIDLNKKFVLVSELFKGDSGAFAKAVQDLDSFDNYKEAFNYMQSVLVKQFGWDENSQSARMFTKMVKQRFGEE
jgi:hypothetical protein